MSLIIKGMSLPKHAAVKGEKDTAYKCLILAHSDNFVELVIDTAFASPYDNGHNIQRYPITEIPTPHGRLIDAAQYRIGKEPLVEENAYSELSTFCPNCSHELDTDFSFCPDCGQSLDWT